MTSRLRDRRRTTNREPGNPAWTGGCCRTCGASGCSARRKAAGFASWRMFSTFIVVSLSILLFLFFSTDLFYVHSIAVGGLKYMSKEEIFALTNIANMQIFSVDPQEVRRNILRSPTVAEADVQVGWRHKWFRFPFRSANRL